MPKLFINQDDRRIFVVIGLTLVMLMLATAYPLYRVMQSQTEAMAVSGLRVALENKVKLIENQIAYSIANTHATSTRIFLAQSLEKLNFDEFREEGIIGLQQSAKKILTTHFSGIKIYDAEDNLILSSGVNSNHAELAVRLDTTAEIETTLLWDKQFIVRNAIRVLNENQQPIGRIATEEYLSDLTALFKEAILIGETGDFLLCAAVKDNNDEMDCFVRGFDGNQFKRIPRLMNDRPLPVHFALDEQSGIKFDKDYRQIEVVAAHSPVAYGLGAVLKMDKEELNDSFNRQVQDVAVYFVLLVLAGMVILYSVTLPLVKRLVASKAVSIKSHKKLISTKVQAEAISSELSAYINAIGNLALISIADRKGKIMQVNEKFCEISGYKQQELIGKDHRLLNSGFHPKSFWVDMWTKVAKGQVWHQEVCNRNKSGNLYWVDSTIVPLIDGHGRIGRYLSVRVDITARKQKDRELNERLKESHCLHEVHICIEQSLSMNKTLQGVMKSVIAAFQFPEMATGKIELAGETIVTADFDEENSQKLSAIIKVNNEAMGKIQIAYMCNAEFLLPHEQYLIDAIARDLGQWHERRSAEQRIVEMATHDALTGLPNRYLLQDRIAQTLAQDSRDRKQMAVLFIDLDHFKNINDSLGHDVGDLLLQEVAKSLISCVRAEDTVARQGGDEFIVVLNSIGKSIDAARVAQKIIDAMKRGFYIDGNECYIGSSIGIAIFPDDGSDAETLLKNSDVAMYHAKESGRNNFQFYTEELNKSIHERQALGLDLRYALGHNEFILHYQPVFDADNQLDSAEALIRWQHPKRGLIAPDRFISLAEESGLIIPIGEWTIGAVCKQINDWKANDYQVPRVAINLSARQFRDNNLVSTIARMLEETGVESKYIALEITESMLIDNIERVVETLGNLNAMGIHILIDDFGTGYSSLNYLKRFPIDTLKIDRSFVRDIAADKNDHAIVSAIIAMAHSLGMNVVAEGIETEEQLTILLQQKCNRFQGYYFSKPVVASEIERFLKKKARRANKLGVIRSV